MKIYIILAVAVITALTAFFIVSKDKSTIQPITTSPIHTPFSEAVQTVITANFEISTNGTKRIFTDPRYHNLSDIVYIDPKSPNQVVVKTEGITWNDFFATLPMSLNKDCLVTGTKQTYCTGSDGQLKFYTNDISNPNALDLPILDGNSLRVIFD
jgi:hypothetical protein